MTYEEQAAICKAIKQACMWGHGGVASVILDNLQKALPQERPWGEVYSKNARQAEYEAVGVITDEAELRSWLSRGYWLTNFEPGEASLFNPPPMNGLCKYVAGALADRYAKHQRGWL